MKFYVEKFLSNYVEEWNWNIEYNIMSSVCLPVWSKSRSHNEAKAPGCLNVLVVFCYEIGSMLRDMRSMKNFIRNVSLELKMKINRR